MAWQPGQSGNPGGRPIECLEVRQVRKLAQARTHDAYAVIEALMVGAEKDTVRLAAAIAVLKIAGLKFDQAPESKDNAPPPPPKNITRAELMQAATQGEA